MDTDENSLPFFVIFAFFAVPSKKSVLQLAAPKPEAEAGAQRRRRFGFPARARIDAGFRSCACAQSKAAWRFASRRTPKMGAACYKSCHNSAVGWECAEHIRRTSRSKCGCPKSPNDPKTRGLAVPLRLPEA